ncbi:MAG: hypothetical protein ACKESB_02970 [Candidatus Hodgkinia cicadicola]
MRSAQDCGWVCRLTFRGGRGGGKRGERGGVHSEANGRVKSLSFTRVTVTPSSASLLFPPPSRPLSCRTLEY